MNKDARSRLAWCFFGDVWGFSHLVQSDAAKVLNSLHRLHQIVITHVQHVPNCESHLLSDNVFLFYPCPEDKTPGAQTAAFEAFVELVEFLITSHWELDLPLRGVITLGEVYRKDRVFLGTPIMEAVECEQHVLVAPVTVIPYSTISAAVSTFSILSSKYLEQREARFVEIPTKDGRMVALPLFGYNKSYMKERLEVLLNRATRTRGNNNRAAGQLRHAIEILNRAGSLP